MAKGGKPVFIDKPLAASYEDAQAIAKLAREKNIKWFSSSTLRYAEGLPALRLDHPRHSPDQRAMPWWHDQLVASWMVMIGSVAWWTSARIAPAITTAMAIFTRLDPLAGWAAVMSFGMVCSRIMGAPFFTVNVGCYTLSRSEPSLLTLTGPSDRQAGSRGSPTSISSTKVREVWMNETNRSC